MLRLNGSDLAGCGVSRIWWRITGAELDSVMDIEFLIGTLLATLIMAVGCIGSVLPGLPGTPLVFVAAVGHRLYFGDRGISTWVLVVLGLLMTISIALDFLAGVYGAKKLGATWRGMTGAGVGALIGIFFGPIGILVGPFLGAFLAEVAGGRESGQAGKAGAGAVLGLIGGALGKLVCSIAMVGLMLFDVLYRMITN